MGSDQSVPRSDSFNIVNAIHKRNGRDLSEILNQIERLKFIWDDDLKEFTEYEVNFLLENLKENKSIKELSIGVRNSHNSMKAISDMLKMNNTIQRLYIWKESHQTLIEDGFISNSTLKSIEIAGATDIDLNIFASILQQNKTISDIEIHSMFEGACVNEKVGDSFVQSIENNESICKFEVRLNNWEIKEQLQKINQKIELNKLKKSTGATGTIK